MCEYCEHDPTWSDNPNEVVMPIGEPGKFIPNAMGQFVNTNAIDLNLFIERDDSGAYIKGYVFGEPAPGAVILAKAEAAIHYCPMCGRKLD